MRRLCRCNNREGMTDRSDRKRRVMKWSNARRDFKGTHMTAKVTSG